MPAAIVWTPDQDAAILWMRRRNASWDEIGNRLHLSKTAVLLRGKHLGAELPPVTEQPVIEQPDRHREPLYPGHPISWGAITKGTSLDSMPYPERVFG